ncbi:uncharacterized protein [Amphiura filiformis]|uniref:uncharacterized protein n=1 Tax=Amphiura filiformis TaxID=82378 RepID=UPI003B20CF31
MAEESDAAKPGMETKDDDGNIVELLIEKLLAQTAGSSTPGNQFSCSVCNGSLVTLTQQHDSTSRILNIRKATLYRCMVTKKYTFTPPSRCHQESLEYLNFCDRCLRVAKRVNLVMEKKQAHTTGDVTDDSTKVAQQVQQNWKSQLSYLSDILQLGTAGSSGLHQSDNKITTADTQQLSASTSSMQQQQANEVTVTVPLPANTVVHIPPADEQQVVTSIGLASVSDTQQLTTAGCSQHQSANEVPGSVHLHNTHQQQLVTPTGLVSVSDAQQLTTADSSSQHQSANEVPGSVHLHNTHQQQLVTPTGLVSVSDAQQLTTADSSSQRQSANEVPGSVHLHNMHQQQLVTPTGLVSVSDAQQLSTADSISRHQSANEETSSFCSHNTPPVQLVTPTGLVSASDTQQLTTAGSSSRHQSTDEVTGSIKKMCWSVKKIVFTTHLLCNN